MRKIRVDQAHMKLPVRDEENKKLKQLSLLHCQLLKASDITELRAFQNPPANL